MIDGFTRGYIARCGSFIALKWPVTLVFVGLLALTAWVYRTVPTGFVPDEDQGYFMVIVQAPDGASLDYTANITNEVEEILKKHEEVRGTFAIDGFSFAGSAPNRGIVFVPLKPMAERRGEEHRRPPSSIARCPEFMGIRARSSCRSCRRAIQGLGNVRRLPVPGAGSHRRPHRRFRRRRAADARAGQPDAGAGGALLDVHRQRSAAGGEVDREKAKALGVG